MEPGSQQKPVPAYHELLVLLDAYPLLGFLEVEDVVSNVPNGLKSCSD